MIRHAQTIRRQFVFDHFVILMLKGLKEKFILVILYLELNIYLEDFLYTN